ncbi:MAG TPA: protein kinase, partial [Nitrospinae bacterium]|nr:protein kinase [Nitrospinota bacterium]
MYNHGFDNDQADYLYEAKEQINYRYEVQKKLGKGAFGVVVRCYDHKNKEVVALKILKNWKKLHKQGKIEIKILETLRDNDHDNVKNIVRIKDSFTFRSHVFISFEMLSINLYQFIKNNDFQGFSMALTKRFSIQCLEALDFMYQFAIVHCDLKPENILLVRPNKSQIKLIDYGSSCFELERFYTYIQSRFYRAPEIMLGIPYTTAIDM